MANLYDRVARLEREIDTLKQALLQNPEAGRYERALAARQHEHGALLTPRVASSEVGNE